MIEAGRVRTQAIAKLRTVDHCRPDRLAAMVPATPEESTCVVLTGSPDQSAAPIDTIAMKPVDEVESQRHQQCKSEQEIRQNRSVVNARQVRRQTGAGVDDADNQHHSETKDSDLPRTLAELGVERQHGYRFQLGWWWKR